MLTVFYVLAAACAIYVILSLRVVRAHEKKRAAKEAEEVPSAEGEEAMPKAQEEEFFSSPIYRSMEFLAHM